MLHYQYYVDDIEKSIRDFVNLQYVFILLVTAEKHHFMNSFSFHKKLTNLSNSFI